MSKQSPLQRIKRIMDYYMKHGTNRESVNFVYKKILNQKFNRDENNN